MSLLPPASFAWLLGVLSGMHWHGDERMMVDYCVVPKHYIYIYKNFTQITIRTTTVDTHTKTLVKVYSPKLLWRRVQSPVRIVCTSSVCPGFLGIPKLADTKVQDYPPIIELPSIALADCCFDPVFGQKGLEATHLKRNIK